MRICRYTGIAAGKPREVPYCPEELYGYHPYPDARGERAEVMVKGIELLHPDHFMDTSHPSILGKRLPLHLWGAHAREALSHLRRGMRIRFSIDERVRAYIGYPETVIAFRIGP